MRGRHRGSSTHVRGHISVQELRIGPDMRRTSCKPSEHPVIVRWECSGWTWRPGPFPMPLRSTFTQWPMWRLLDDPTLSLCRGLSAAKDPRHRQSSHTPLLPLLLPSPDRLLQFCKASDCSRFSHTPHCFYYLQWFRSIKHTPLLISSLLCIHPYNRRWMFEYFITGRKAVFAHHTVLD